MPTEESGERVELTAEPRNRGRLEPWQWWKLREAFRELDPTADAAEVDAAAGAGALLFGYQLPRSEDRPAPASEPGALEHEPGQVLPPYGPKPDAGR